MNTDKCSFWFPFSVVFFEIATYLANDMYLPALPALMEDFHISQLQAQNTLLYWFLGSASMQLLIGPLSDRYGRKIILLLGAVLFTATSFICANTTQVIPFFIARFIQGCAVCSVVVAGYAAIHELYETRVAIKIISLMGSVVVLAPAFGPIIGALILELAPWRSIFYVLGISGLLSFLLLLKVMPKSKNERFPMHVKSIVKDYAVIATRKHFLVFTLPFCFMFLSLISWVVESPFLIIDSYHKTTLEYGLIQLYVFGFFIIGAQITSLSVHRVHPITIIKVGLSIALIASLFLIMFSAQHAPLAVIVILMMFVALGFAMTFGPLSRFAIESCFEPMGRRMAILSSYMGFSGVMATFIVGEFESDSMFNLSLMISLGSMLAFAVFFFIKKPNLSLDEKVSAH